MNRKIIFGSVGVFILVVTLSLIGYHYFKTSKKKSVTTTKTITKTGSIQENSENNLQTKTGIPQGSATAAPVAPDPDEISAESKKKFESDSDDEEETTDDGVTVEVESDDE
jgi:hypothetical protein